MLSGVVTCITRMSLCSNRSGVVSAACVKAMAVHVLNKVLTPKLVNSKFCYCCWQLKSFELKILFSVFFVYFVVELNKNTNNVFYMGTKWIRRGGLSVHYQLHITILLLPTKNCKNAFEFPEVIIRNIVSFFISDAVETAFRWRHNYVSTTYCSDIVM